MSNNLTTSSWKVDLPTEDSFMAVNTQSITKTSRTLKLFFQTTKKYSISCLYTKNGGS